VPDETATGDAAADGLYGYLVSFDTVEQLLAAAATVRDAGYSRWDAHTPFVVHGLDAAMGIRRRSCPTWCSRAA